MPLEAKAGQACPQLTFIAGPNGAGKTTFFNAFLKGAGRYFVNADHLTRSLGITNPEAARAADAIRGEFVRQGVSFITETVFSDALGAKLEFLRSAVGAGFEVRLIYVGLSSVELSEARVATRVALGGHDVPSGLLARRYEQSLKNLKEAVRFVPEVHIYDNSSSIEPMRCVATMKDRRVKWGSMVPAWFKTAIGGQAA